MPPPSRCEDFVQSLQTHAQHGRRGTRALVTAPPPPAALPPSPASAPSPRRNTALLPLAIGAVVAIITIAALIISSQSEPDTVANVPATTPATSAPATTTSTSPTAVNTQGFAAMRDVVTNYYGLLPDNTQEAWKMLSESYQDQTGGQRQYRDFWSSIRSVSVDSVTPRGEMSVSAQLTYTLRNGSTNSEQRWFEIERSDDKLIIADSGLGS